MRFQALRASLLLLVCAAVLTTLPHLSLAAQNNVGTYVVSEGEYWTRPRRDISINVTSNHDYYTMAVYDTAPPAYSFVEQRNDKWKSWVGGTRVFLNVDLSFSVRFYGHRYRNIKITSGGFLSLVPDDTDVTTFSFFIAPLMSEFTYNTTLDTPSIYYRDTGSELYVQWDGIRLNGNQTDEPFRFQCRIDHMGRIIFSYDEIPISPADIKPVDLFGSGSHPIKAGLGDAFQRVGNYQGQTFIVNYHYHEVSVPLGRIANGAAVILDPEPTCNLHHTCTDCLAHETDFDCGWCDELQICTDGIDRNQESYVQAQCHFESVNIDPTESCPSSSEPDAYQFSFSWSKDSFSDDCWGHLAIRLDLEEEEMVQRTVLPKDEAADREETTVTFVASLMPKRAEIVEGHLQSNMPLVCGNVGNGTITSAASTKQGGGGDGVDTTLIAIVVSCAAVALILISVTAFMLHAYRNPASRAGQWLINHRCSGLCCSSGAANIEPRQPYADMENHSADIPMDDVASSS